MVPDVLLVDGLAVVLALRLRVAVVLAPRGRAAVVLALDDRLAALVAVHRRGRWRRGRDDPDHGRAGVLAVVAQERVLDQTHVLGDEEPVDVAGRRLTPLTEHLDLAIDEVRATHDLGSRLELHHDVALAGHGSLDLLLAVAGVADGLDHALLGRLGLGSARLEPRLDVGAGLEPLLARLGEVGGAGLEGVVGQLDVLAEAHVGAGGVGHQLGHLVFERTGLDGLRLGRLGDGLGRLRRHDPALRVGRSGLPTEVDLDHTAEKGEYDEDGDSDETDHELGTHGSGLVGRVVVAGHDCFSSPHWGSSGG